MGVTELRGRCRRGLNQWLAVQRERVLVEGRGLALRDFVLVRFAGEDLRVLLVARGSFKRSTTSLQVRFFSKS